MDAASEKSVRLPTFDGANKNYQLWWTRFQAYAMVYKFGEALVVGGEADMPASESMVIDETTPAGKLEAAAKKRNAIAMASFTMSFTSEGTMGLVYKAKTTTWPCGLVHTVVAALAKKYQPQDTITRVKLRQKLNKIKMKKNEDPAKLFEQISQIENKYNTAAFTIDSADLIAVVLDAAPKEYQAVLTAKQRRQGVNLTINNLEVMMNQHW